MHYATRVKDELARIIPETLCCRCWEMAGLAQATPLAGSSLLLPLRHASLARKFLLLQKETGSKRPLLNINRNRRYRYMIDMPEFPPLDINAQGLPARRCCQRAFIRGAFLAKGSITDPDRTYHLEITTDSARFAHLLVQVCEEWGLHAQEIPKRRGYVVYLKDGESISEFLRFVEAHQALLDWENTRIVKDMKNTVNRLVNAETANVDKTVTAAMMQIAGIKFLMDKMGLEKLPHRLREIARVRLDMPYASLTELAENLDPPISKSAANYRLRRLLNIAYEQGFQYEQTNNLEKLSK